LRKKSHILLARYLADQMVAADELQSHRKAFCLGSILPDMKPSFLTTKHEFNGTFAQVGERMRDLTVDCDLYERNERVYWRRLGEVIHYVADYFTFPHNETYGGTLLEHGQYEKELKNGLKTYIASGQAWNHVKEDEDFKSLQEILVYIQRNHRQYLSKERNVKDDIAFILRVCYQVVQGMFRLLAARYQRAGIVLQYA
jgi:hypothetical protein